MPGNTGKKFGDVGVNENCEARGTEYRNGHLPMHKDDADDRTYYLVTGTYPIVSIIGSLKGCDGKRQEWWDTEGDPPCYMVPQDVLEPFV